MSIEVFFSLAVFCANAAPLPPPTTHFIVCSDEGKSSAPVHVSHIVMANQILSERPVMVVARRAGALF